MNARTVQIPKTAVQSLQNEAKRLKTEFEDYLDDLKMFSNPEFWEAIQETHKRKGKEFSTINDLLKELGK